MRERAEYVLRFTVTIPDVIYYGPIATEEDKLAPMSSDAIGVVFCSETDCIQVSSYFKRRDWRCVLLRDRLHARSVLEISFALS